MVLEYKEVYMLLGSNLGDREQMMRQAIEKIETEIGVVSAKSVRYETEPWGNTDQPAFINMAIAVQTALGPVEVLETALNIEKELGRTRIVRWGSRTIDIDLIFYADEIIEIEGKLSIPHPEMQKRRFVLEPLAEIAPDFMHPVFKKSVKELLHSLTDNTTVEKYNF
jgi:2-amino-4-hydroxy-6-hydroxymethyldihydropteridine diphosphokinase